MENFMQYMLDASKYALIVLSLVMIIRCLCSMFSIQDDSYIWGYFRFIDKDIPIHHWENLIGRAHSCDIRIGSHSVARLHAILRRSDSGEWKIYNIFSKSEIEVNNIPVGPKGAVLKHDCTVSMGGCPMRFRDITAEQRKELEGRLGGTGPRLSQSGTLFTLTLFQLALLLQHMMTALPADRKSIALGFAALISMEWACYNAMRLIERKNFELETLAFYLSTLGMSVAASSTPEDIYKQIILTLVSILLFLLLGWWLRSLRRTAGLRLVMGFLALGFLALNVAGGEVSYGARNWLEIGGFSFQPSEFVKVLYVYVGASTLDRLYRSRNLYGFIVFSALCVVALALIGDFGTALIFFVCFLVISFMRSGSMATVLLAVSGAALAVFLVISVKPYIAQRFATWGHAWEDVYNAGYQQTRAMSAAASGGLFGKGAGAGWLKDIFAANTDMVFAVICEELGLVSALCMVLAVLSLAFFAVRSIRHSRSAYYSIAACAAVTILLCQLALNVFGSLDLLPFTGVTFPFVSRGGSSLISCWMLMAFIKSSDNRKDASFTISRKSRFKTTEADISAASGAGQGVPLDDSDDEQGEEDSLSPISVKAPERDFQRFRTFYPEESPHRLYHEGDDEDEWEEWKP